MRHDLMRNEDEETIEQFLELADNYAIEFLNYYIHSKVNRKFLNLNLSAEEYLKFFKQETKI